MTQFEWSDWLRSANFINIMIEIFKYIIIPYFWHWQTMFTSISRTKLDRHGVCQVYSKCYAIFFHYLEVSVKMAWYHSTGLPKVQVSMESVKYSFHHKHPLDGGSNLNQHQTLSSCQEIWSYSWIMAYIWFVYLGFVCKSQFVMHRQMGVQLSWNTTIRVV